MNLENIGKDCPCYEVDCSDIMFDIGEFCGLPPNNGKLTIQVNGSTVGDFSANQQEDETINITTPTSQDIADAVAGEALLRQQADNTLQANIDAEELARQRADREIQAVLDGESLARVNGDKNLQSQIDAIASKSDVVDVVGTYAELQAYDTTKLDDNDVVKVLDDSTHNDSMTYYRWNETTQTWSYIGQESPYYSKSQTDTLLAQKQDNLTAGTGITLNGSTISADTTVLAEKSELANYAEKSNTYTKSEVDTLVEPKLSVDVVDSLPAVGEENKLYLTPKAHTDIFVKTNMPVISIEEDSGGVENFITYGSTAQSGTPTPTSPITPKSVIGGTIIATGKNILDQTGMPETFSLNGVSGTFDKNTGIITLNGTCNRDNTVFALTGSGNVFVLNGEFTISVEHISGTISNPTNDTCVQMFASGYSQKILALLTNGNTSNTYTRTKIAYTIKNFRVDNGVSFNNYKFRVMVEPGKFATKYELNRTKYFELNLSDYGISLNSLGQYTDYIYKDGNSWKLHSEVGVASFNGEEAWFNSSETDSSVQVCALNITALACDFTNKSLSLMDRFVLNNNLNDKMPGIFRLVNNASGNVNHIRLFLDKNTASSLEDEVEWIANNKPTIFYPKRNSTEITITDSLLLEKLNNIADNLGLARGVNTVKLYSSSITGDFGINYYGYDQNNNYDEFIWKNGKYEELTEKLPVYNEGYVLDSGTNKDSDFWSMWNSRLSMGIETETAIVPAKFNGQIFVDGTIIAHNAGDMSHNRHALHIYEGYARDDYSRYTLLTDKHNSEFDGKKSLELYYYTGASHKAEAYGNTKIGSDVKYHSFLFNRDKMIAAGEVDCRFPITLARINPATDLDNTYQTVGEADAAYEAESMADENLKCLKYIALKNASDGCMWYDTARNKIVVKINGKWHDINTTEVPEGTYGF